MVPDEKSPTYAPPTFTRVQSADLVARRRRVSKPKKQRLKPWRRKVPGLRRVWTIDQYWSIAPAHTLHADARASRISVGLPTCSLLAEATVSDPGLGDRGSDSGSGSNSGGDGGSDRASDSGGASDRA